MGSSNVKSVINQVSELTNDVIQETINKCITASSQIISRKIKEVKGDFVMSGNKDVQTSTINVSCLMSLIQNGDLSDKISNKLIEVVDSNNQTLKFGEDKVDAQKNIKATIQNSLNQKQENIQSSINEQSNILEVGTFEGNFRYTDNTIEQTSKLITKIVIDSLNITKIIKEIENTTNSKTSQKTVTPIDAITKSISDTAKTISEGVSYNTSTLVIGSVVSVAIICIFILILIIFFYSSS